MARKYFIAGNWKMNKTAKQAAELAKGLVASVGAVDKVDVAICPTFTSLAAAGKEIAGSKIKLGAQNVYFEASGAFTGEISTEMLLEAGCTYVILGHSERREYFKESDEFINKKVCASINAGLKPILCVGETLAEREGNVTMDVVSRQTLLGLEGVCEVGIKSVVIAYEPVWAIGTGKTATPAMAQEVHAGIRAILAKKYGGEIASGVQILYGGSMKPDNAAELLAETDIDGGLIGGAALKVDSFAALINAAVAAK